MGQYEQFNFAVGEIDDKHVWRVDLAVRGGSVKRARNVRITKAGTLKERLSTEKVALLQGDGIVETMVVGHDAYLVVLTDQRLEVYDKATRAHVQTVTGCAWTLAMLTDEDDPLVVAPYAEEGFVFHTDLAPQVIRRSTAGVWSVAAYAFADGLGSSKRQPYYRFADRGVTLTPGALTGTGVTIEASASVFAAGQDELRFRLQGREFQMKSYVDADTITADVIQAFHPTKSLTVASNGGFDVGALVEGKDSFAQAEVTGVSGSTGLTVLMQEFTDFAWDAATSTGEVITGPNGSTTTTAAASAASNAAVLDWDEQAISSYRGYPATGAIHRGRLWMARLPLVPFAVLGSAIDDFYDFGVGVNDADPLFVELGDENAGAVRHIFSSEQLLIFTSGGLYYNPESEANPIRPSSFTVLRVGPDGASPCKPVQLSEGVAYVKAGGSALLGAFPTGDVRRSWKTSDLSVLSSHLLNTPRSLAYVAGGADDAERNVFAVNADGTMAAVLYSDAAEIYGWTGWSTDGEFRSVTAHEGECWAVVKRTLNGSTAYQLEVFEPDRWIDGAVTVDSLQGDATTETITGVDGVMTADKVHRYAPYAGTTCALMQGGLYIGEVTLDADGDFGVLDMDGDIELGFAFECAVTPWHPMPDQDRRSVRRVRRITRQGVRWRGRYMAIDGVLQPLYQWGEDTTEAPPERDEFLRTPVFNGWEEEPTVAYTRPYPGPWEFIGYSFEVKE